MVIVYVVLKSIGLNRITCILKNICYNKNEERSGENHSLIIGGNMKEKIKGLVDSKIEEFNVFVDDAFVEELEGKDVLNIVLDSEEVIDLNKITECSRIINEELDKQEKLLDDIYEVDIYSKEKGE